MVHDIGVSLEVGAHVTALHRYLHGSLSEEGALAFEDMSRDTILGIVLREDEIKREEEGAEPKKEQQKNKKGKGRKWKR